MENGIIYCDICPGSVEMILVEKLKTHTNPHTSYRRRRFECPVCGHRKLIMGDGAGDEKHIPQQAIDEIKEIARQESENRNFITSFDFREIDRAMDEKQ